MPNTRTSFDHLEPSSTAEVRAAYENMRESCPLAHSDRHGGYDFVNRYADVRAALHDAVTFSSADGVFVPPSGLPPTPALEFDDPEHSTWLTVMRGPLTLKAVRGFEASIGKIVDDLVDGFAARGSADLVTELAEPMPAIVIGELVGLDRPQAVDVRELAAALFASIGTPDFPERMAQFTEYTENCLEDRRREPRDDYLTALVNGEIAGIPIGPGDVVGLLVAYLVGGHHSTSSGLAGLLRHVLTEPGLRDKLAADENLLPHIIEESLRLTTPLQLFARTATLPVALQDETLPAGRRVLLNLASANRDPREFEDPDQFSTQRGRNRHLSFGAGSHACLGQHLARAELRIATTRLLERLPDLQVDGEIVESGLIGGTLMTIQSLPVRFTPAS
jgi:cytochrome P450